MQSELGFPATLGIAPLGLWVLALLWTRATFSLLLTAMLSTPDTRCFPLNLVVLEPEKDAMLMAAAFPELLCRSR